MDIPTKNLINLTEWFDLECFHVQSELTKFDFA